MGLEEEKEEEKGEIEKVKWDHLLLPLLLGGEEEGGGGEGSSTDKGGVGVGGGEGGLPGCRVRPLSCSRRQQQTSISGKVSVVAAGTQTNTNLPGNSVAPPEAPHGAEVQNTNVTLSRCSLSLSFSAWYSNM